MNKRVLLPTDYSKNALNAIRYALELYSNVRCDFYILNAFHISGYTLDSMRVPEIGEPYYEAAKEESEEGMERLMQIIKLHPQNDKHQFHTITTFNSLSEAIKIVIDKKDIDIIVMGTKGITESKARIFGTNTVNVMEQIQECPIIAVPNDYMFQIPREVVFPTDYKTPFKRKEIGDLIEIAKLHDAKINVVHIDKDKDGKLSRKEEMNKELLQEILQGTDYEMHFLPADKISDGINKFIEENNCDMVAFLNRKHLFFGSVLSNPLVKKIGFDPQVPILELNDN
ncbi:UspA domain-containing protein [Allomuricauda ruestringensis DSM 13258]|uniref:UspA domain-containing protein n=1 Tax=Allomuricauda ruestringensis (strain DSM 13258 / CIP 107369 / LMG 19739 / B1) TaxID=886377 RepID=G2PJ53_ALLRU|nr:universal stress protein [Allomuricauda ruestringensis]AEM71874.1 UspA domain-containing protein [Allomuricauda ruestringensis DSM 13258]